MADLDITRDSELMVAQVEGTTEDGIEFVDAYCPVGAEFQVVDAGRIIIPEDAVEALYAVTREHGLTYREETRWE